jgi:hypothetical protein
MGLPQQEAERWPAAAPVTDKSKVDDVVASNRTESGARDVESYYERDVAVEVPLA